MKTALFAVLLAISALAQAQPRHERYHTPHWVYDDRFHHNHYYPAVGYSLAVLPPGNVVVNFRTGRYFFHSGVWYQAAGPQFVVVRPPLGVVIPVLPPAYTTVWVSNTPYYYANDVYYVQAPGGYAVAQPPDETPAPAAPVAQAPAPTPGNWYYCESSKTYYPYVQQCAEGWRTVPATPPGAPR